MVIAPDLEPMDLAAHLKERAILSQIDWYDATPHLVGIRVAIDGGTVATLDAEDSKIHHGPMLSDLVEDLAETFKAEVMMGDVAVDRIEGDHEDLLAKHTPSDLPVRVVEIGTSPSSAVPLMAAFEGVDIAEMDLPAGKRLLAAQVPSSRAGWYFGDVPLVTLTTQGDEFQALFVKEDDPEGIISYNWGMNELIIAGAQGWDSPLAQIAHVLVGSQADIEAIHDAVPGIDVDGAFEASRKRGPEAVKKFVESLGLGDDITGYLLGLTSLEQIEGARVHHARGISNAIGRSVDMIIDERQGESSFWNVYTGVVRKRPWLVPLISAVEASVGLSLLALSGKRAEGKRSAIGKVGTIAGAMFLFDSVAELVLARHTIWRAERREAREAGRI